MAVLDLSSWIVIAIDDEPDSLEVLTEVLMLHDVTVHPANTGAEVLQLLETVTPTLVITDLSMPNMDGYQLLYRIRHNPKTAHTKVLALTAHTMKGDRERIMSTGFDGYLMKPLRMNTLIPAIMEYLSSTPAVSDLTPVGNDNRSNE